MLLCTDLEIIQPQSIKKDKQIKANVCTNQLPIPQISHFQLVKLTYRQKISRYNTGAK